MTRLVKRGEAVLKVAFVCCSSNPITNSETTNLNFHEFFFDQLKQVLQVCLFCVETPNSGFVVSEVVVGSGEQDIELSHPSNFTAFS